MGRISTILFLIISFYSFGTKGPEITFKENKGQVGDQFSKPRLDVLFVGHAGEMNFHLRNNGISYQLCRVDSWKEHKDEFQKKLQRLSDKTSDQITIYRLDINWLNIERNVEVLKENSAEGYENYYNEVCPNGVTGVKTFKNITYKNLYQGIDLKWYEKDGNLKYDYIIEAGADHAQIQFEIKGAESISLGKNGELIITTPLGVVEEKAPYVTQDGKVLKAKWLINKNIISFEIADVDKSKQLTIDPLVRLWGTYYGGINDDGFTCSSVDASGNIYATGWTSSANNIATAGAHQVSMASSGADDGILVKFNSWGLRLWATYYGGSGSDSGEGCSVNTGGDRIAMVGNTSTTVTGVIATPGSHQTNCAGGYDGFVAVFDDTGVRKWGTYYGGSTHDSGSGCSFSGSNDLYIVGYATSTNNIASPGAHQPIYGGTRDGFLAKFNLAGTRQWGTYYGGTLWDFMEGCVVDGSGDVYTTGYAQSNNNISTPGAYQTVKSGPLAGDAIVVKFNSSGIRQWGNILRWQWR
jgi:hypothetical protein